LARDLTAPDLLFQRALLYFVGGPWLLIGAAVVLSMLVALSLHRSQPSHAIANDPQYVLSNTSRHSGITHDHQSR
jgi:hypothetical protein